MPLPPTRNADALPPDTSLSDVTLIERTRAGDIGAYGILHERHAGSAQALARRMSRNPTPTTWCRRASPGC